MRTRDTVTSEPLEMDKDHVVAEAGVTTCVGTGTRLPGRGS
jgi:hypothetical protein